MVKVTDLRECNQKIMENNKNISDVKEHLSVLSNDVKWIRKAIEGNGKKGLIEKVEENTKWRYYIIAGGTVVFTIISFVMNRIFK